MIAHGRQQILPPNMIIGRTQIQGACIGREVVFGSFWLSASAQAAILGAFGQRDGMAVINATNAYLNGIAVQGQAGKAKAQALAALINEDPMMVCSLGLEVEGVTMPHRYIRGGKGAWINTGFYGTRDTNVIYKGISSNESGTCFIFGADRGWQQADSYNCVVRYTDYNTDQIEFGSIGTQSPITPANTRFTVEVDNGKWKNTLENGTVLWSYDYSNVGNFTTPEPMAIFNNNRAGSTPSTTRPYSFCESLELINSIAHKLFIPCKHPTQGNGMLDLVNVVFYPNAGTGSFTIPDISYTPSTPTPDAF